MLKLIVDNSYCRLEGLTVHQFKQLKKLMSYSINATAAYFSGTHRNTRCLITPRGEFPTGLLYIVKDYFKKARVPLEVCDARKVPTQRPGMFKMELK